ncbi:transcriptional regulator NrdR [Thermus scotoductus]|uniref:Transcriptional repressor NrdR n=1 Tax=Thermus scotoductus TaxID=37636 RepID=A0A430V3G9_THESC|nr:transcriptional regulator NrdR [Thermus scotoductus]RTH99996.1 transcriptional regulator NrdR [Thermus scotoductus]RTI17268.1 transcriptional regulator NrdR [Thermus scotoductus]
MKCPYCGHPDTRVVDSRPSDEGAAIRRRRECPACGRRFTTYERTQLEPLMVVKRDGRREPFNADKLLRGLLLACEKRPVDPEVLRRFAYTFEDQVTGPEISSEEIGLKAMAFLRDLDHVAYIRFASVYREFDSVERFIEEIQRLGGVDKKEGA